MKPRPNSFNSSKRNSSKRRRRSANTTEAKKKRDQRPRSHGSRLTPKNSRQLAFYLVEEGDILYEREKGAVAAPFPTDRLEYVFKKFPLEAEERRLTHELVSGTIRRRATLDKLISACCERPLEEIELELIWLLRLGVYQLAFLDSIPDHAAVHETVEVAKWYRRPRWCNFMNGILRSVGRLLKEEKAKGKSQATFPLKKGDYRELAKSIFANPDTKPLRYLSESNSFPLWLLERWQERFSLEELDNLVSWFNQPAPLYLRVNTLKTTPEEMLVQFETAEIPIEQGTLPISLRVLKSYSVPNMPGYEEGWFAVQDETPQQVCALLNPQPGETVWDLCAAPGTKTTHLASLMKNEGFILATDINPDRLKRVTENAERLGVSIVKQTVLPEKPPYAITQQFDAILIDAPCSNTGVLGKRPEARWRLRQTDIEELVQIQRGLLETAIAFLKPNGRILYSTCSIEQEENETQVRQFLERHPDFSLAEEHAFIPGQPADGGYAALLTR